MDTINGAAAPKPPFARGALRVVLATALILLVPLVAMQFTREVAWGPLDFAVAAALLAGTGLGYLALVRRTSLARHRLAIAAGLAVALLLVWSELAVGVFGTPFAGS